ncbi:MAG TPA: AAA family ATPase [Streptosporangiaceae bacterium]|nr:AAA family ATPase [Streptosporangiaceae bacterium]
MITKVLGAPGSGKSTVAQPLAALLPAHVVLDWDAFMDPAAALAGREIRQSPDTWPAYRQLVRTVLDTMKHLSVVLLGVCTPAELSGWPIDAWIVLDCTDQERRRRLGQRSEADDVQDAILDAREYRALGLPVIDTTGQTPQRTAADLAEFIDRLEVAERER